MTPADDCGLPHLVGAEGPKQAARLLMPIAAPLTAPEQRLQ